MKLLKRFYTSLKIFFGLESEQERDDRLEAIKKRKELQAALEFTTARDKKIEAEKARKANLSDSERRYEWLCSKGYTPEVHLGTDPKPDTPKTHYRDSVLTFMNKKAELEKTGKKILYGNAKERNSYGIPVQMFVV